MGEPFVRCFRCGSVDMMANWSTDVNPRYGDIVYAYHCNQCGYEYNSYHHYDDLDEMVIEGGVLCEARHLPKVQRYIQELEDEERIREQIKQQDVKKLKVTLPDEVIRMWEGK